MFTTLAGQASDCFRNVFGEAVTYARAGQTSISLTAIREEEDARGVDENGVHIKAAEVRFIIAASAITYGDPAHGDTITDSAGRVYDIRWDETEKLTDTSDWRIPAVEVP